MSDKTLKRDGLKQIIKDVENGELLYAIRSVLQNLPWIRKIFILMPNEKVKFLKPINEINEKIVYVKDKDMLGFDSASSVVFEFNLWRLKKFGVSNNFIYLNDDYFIGKPLKKTDFFYVDNNKVVPYILFNNPIYLNGFMFLDDYVKSIRPDNVNLQTHNEFQFKKMNTVLLFKNSFKKVFYGFGGNLHYYPHNALGHNLDEVEECYTFVKNNYAYANDTLNSKLHTINTLVEQTFYQIYLINIYNRRVYHLPDSYIDINKAFFSDFNTDLYCINTGGDRIPNSFIRAIARFIMKNLFPEPTSYELQQDFPSECDVCFFSLNCIFLDFSCRC